MSDIPSAYERMSSGTCSGFQWIGQPFSSCDRCARPYWEHSHMEKAKPGKPLFSGTLRVVIPTTEAQQVRAKWGAR